MTSNLTLEDKRVRSKEVSKRMLRAWIIRNDFGLLEHEKTLHQDGYTKN